jgi:hypothetical protein
LFINSNNVPVAALCYAELRLTVLNETGSLDSSLYIRESIRKYLHTVESNSNSFWIPRKGLGESVCEKTEVKNLVELSPSRDRKKYFNSLKVIWIKKPLVLHIAPDRNNFQLLIFNLKGTLARDFGLPFFIIKRMLLVP